MLVFDSVRLAGCPCAVPVSPRNPPAISHSATPAAPPRDALATPPWSIGRSVSRVIFVSPVSMPAPPRCPRPVPPPSAAARVSARPALLRFQASDSLPQFPVLPVRLDHVQREFLHLGQQLRLHLAQADALGLDLLGCRDIRQVAVRLDVGRHLAQRLEAVARW